LQAGGHRFDPGTLHKETRWKRRVSHDLRDTFASLLIAGGADIVHVSRQLGHSDPAITLRV
jgi:integrase